MVDAFKEVAGGAFALCLVGGLVWLCVTLENRYRARRPTETQRSRADHHHETGAR